MPTQQQQLEEAFANGMFEVWDWVERWQKFLILSPVLCRRAEDKYNIKFIDWKFIWANVIVYESKPLSSFIK